MPPDLDAEKRLAAAASLAYVERGMLVGLGSGSTSAHMVTQLGERVRQGLGITAVATSRQTRELATRAGIPLIEFDGSQRIDLTIDGADEVDPALRMIKGGGAALLYEKIIASASERMIVIIDSTKAVASLGAFPLPVEVVGFGWKRVARVVRDMGGSATLRVDGDGAAVRTDEGNLLLDCRWAKWPDPESLARVLDSTTGIVEHGLFIGLAHTVIIGEGATTRELRRPEAR